MSSPRRPRGWVVVVSLLVTAGGCAVGGTDETEPTTTSDPRRLSLAATPAVDGPDLEIVPPTATSSPSVRSRRDAGDAPSPAPASPSPTAQAFRTILALDDGRDDAGASTPPYADVRRLRIESTTDAARFTVEMNGDLRSKLAEGEVIGLGIDLHRDENDRDGSYQLFADGGELGWFGYLHTPKGFVRYEGSFAVKGNRIVFGVPWAAVGDLRAARVSVFCDWSQRRTILSRSGADRAPDSGTTAYGG